MDSEFDKEEQKFDVNLQAEEESKEPAVYLNPDQSFKKDKFNCKACLQSFPTQKLYTKHRKTT